MRFTDFDTQMMHIALALAEKGRFSTSPNPRVGCVIVQDKHIVGQGFHQKAGEPHAEVHALRQAGQSAKGATAYVTLEPCSHYGRTPPCAEGLIAAGVSKVIAAMSDPNPQVAGKGLLMLQQAGIETSCGLLETQARELNRGFLSRIERQRPFFRLKCATSLDGKTALADGKSQWITGEAARLDVQTLRAESCAVLTGIGTVLADNPQLNVRAFPTIRQPIRIVLDSQLRIPLNCRLLQDHTAPVWIVTLSQDANKLQILQTLPHVQIIHAQAQQQQINLHHLAHQLAQLGVGEVMIEAGATVQTAFLTANLVDEMVLYQAPKILGNPARGLFQLPEQAQALQEYPDWQTTSVQTIGDDIKWVLRYRKH